MSLSPVTTALSTVDNPAVKRPASRWLWLILFVLVASTWAIYAPVAQFGFVALDDADYVADNPRVLSGLTSENAKWAFTTVHACNWHPLTWLSHQLDTTLFGAGPAAPHRTNLVLHTLNTGLLLLLLHRLTGSIGRSALVTTFFALHPLRIESVAWIAERKDVLSACFFLLTLYSYSRFAQSAETARRWSWYAGSLVLFALGLLSKPMLVTLPCVLLLLDFWPLRRARLAASGAQSTRSLAALLREKIPFLLLSAASCVITFVAQNQGGAVRSLESFTLVQRISNAFVAYAQYLGKTFWPLDLAVYYPHPGQWPVLLLVVATLVLAGLSFVSLRKAASHPFVPVGWFWFVGMLFPTIGLVQVGNQAMADRYTYLPSIGLFILLVWGADALTRRVSLLRTGMIAASALAITALVLLTRSHLPRWHDSETLFRHTLAVTKNNFAAHHSLGYTLLTRGDTDAAIGEFQQALLLRPRFPEALNNLGNAYLRKQDPQAAVAHYERALSFQPSLSQARYNLGTTLLQLGRLDEAITALTLAADAQPTSPWTQLNLGNAFLQKGDLAQAIVRYQNTVTLQPDLADAHDNLGVALHQAGRAADALRHFEQALSLAPRHANAHAHLGNLLFQLERIDEGIAHFQQAVAANPSDADNQQTLAFALLQQRRIRSALPHLETALQLQPENLRTLAGLAWILATCPDDRLRNGGRAATLTEKALSMANAEDPFLLHVLAAAHAENGQFPAAIASAEKALIRADQLPDRALSDAIKGHLLAYAARTPLRDAALEPGPQP